MILEILLIIIVILLVGIIYYVFIKEKSLKTQLVKLKADNKNIYTKQLDSLKQQLKKPQELLYEFDKIMRQFFKQKFNLNFEFTYEELLKQLKQENNPDYNQFFNELSFLTYSPEKPTKKQVMKLIDSFKFRILNKDKDQKVQKQLKEQELLEQLYDYEKYKQNMEKFSRDLNLRLKKRIITKQKYNEIIQKNLQGKTPKKWIKIFNKKIDKIKNLITKINLN